MNCRNIVFLLILLLQASCASLISKRSIEVNIKANQPKTRIVYNDSSFELPTTLHVERSKKDLKFTLINDSLALTRPIALKPHVGAPFLFGNIIFTYFGGYIIDLTNPKRFEYGKSYSINVEDTATTLTARRRPFRFDIFDGLPGDSKKGSVNFFLSFPHVNAFYLRPVTESAKSSIGFMGISTALEYFYVDNKSIRATIGTATDFMIPIPAPLDYSGELERSSSNYFSLTRHLQKKQFTIGYGLNYTRNTWRKDHTNFGGIPVGYAGTTKSNTLVGLAFSSAWHLTKTFNIGLTYRPSLLRLNPTTNFQYEHSISLEFIFKFKM